MKFKSQKGFIPKYYKKLERMQVNKKLKIYICILFLANLIVTPITVNEINAQETLKREMTERVKAITIASNDKKIEDKKSIKNMNAENLINIAVTLKEDLLELKYENGKVTFKSSFDSQIDGEKSLNTIKNLTNKNFNYASVLDKDRYVFSISEE